MLVILTRDFGAEVATQIEMGLSMLDQDDWETLCKRELAHLEECDALIVDATDKSTFGVGYQAAVAIAKNKPTLLLLRENSLRGSFISGLKHPALIRRQFNDGNVRDVVSDFLRQTQKRIISK
jgi:hypothetical protein